MSCHVSVDFHLPESDRDVMVIFDGGNYRLDDGSQLPVWETSVWCSDCANFEAGEEIPSLATLRKLLASAIVIRLLRRTVKHPIEDVRRRIAWRKIRRSPPRCLNCGGTNIYLLPDHTEFAHPETGELVISTGSGLLCIEGCIKPGYTTEGERIQARSAGE